MACNSVCFSFFSQFWVFSDVWAKCAWVWLPFSLVRRQLPCQELNQQLYTKIHGFWPLFRAEIKLNLICHCECTNLFRILNAESQKVQSEQLVLVELLLLFFAFSNKYLWLLVRLPTLLCAQSFMPVIYYSYATHVQKNWFQNIEFERKTEKRSVQKCVCCCFCWCSFRCRFIRFRRLWFHSVPWYSFFLWFRKVFYTQPYEMA